MFPTLFIGCVLIVASGRYAYTPLRSRLPVVIGLGVLTFIAAWLGCVTGVIKTLTTAGELDAFARGNAVVVGIGESLVNVGLGLVLLVLAGIGVVVGLSRAKSEHDVVSSSE